MHFLLLCVCVFYSSTFVYHEIVLMGNGHTRYTKNIKLKEVGMLAAARLSLDI